MRRSDFFRLFIALWLISIRFPVPAQTGSRQDREVRMEWWREARFGMFIHWGLYAIPAGEWNGGKDYGEWIRHSARIPLAEYNRLQDRFNPVDFDAEQWVKTARDAGMKYIVITSKHHDGFCMFATGQTSFNISETPFGRDVLKELAVACRKYGVRLCFYYSIMDWHHPDYLPRRDWETGRSADSADFGRYVSYMKRQLEELLTEYGDIGVLWFDGEWESSWNDTTGKAIYDFVRGLQPEIIINNRVGAGRMDMEGMNEPGTFGGDFGTPEQQIPPGGIPGTDWETCMTMNSHWGYNKADTGYKSSAELIGMLADIASKGGNFLLNVGPTAEGKLPDQAVARLREMGNWIRTNGESIYGTLPVPVSEIEWGRCTMRHSGDTVILYLHIFDSPANGILRLDGCLNQPLDAVLLSDPGNPVPVGRDEDKIVIELPQTASGQIIPVIRLRLKGPLEIIHPPVIKADNDLFVDRISIELVSDRPDVEIRFTGDGSDPVDTSFLYTGPLEIRGGAGVKARCFRNGKPVSGTSTRNFRMVLPMAPRNVENPVPGLLFRYYEGEWDSLPCFDSLAPLRSGTLSFFVLEPQNDRERFGYVYSGYILIPKRGLYTFGTASDDGSRLFIGKKLVVDNDRLHGVMKKEGSVGLAPGFHPIRVEFFEKTGSEELKVYVRSPGLPERLIPEEWLVH